MTQLTRNVARISQQVQQTQQQQPPPLLPEADAAFHWSRLLRPTPDFFPLATTGQVQRLATGVLAKLPHLSGRDHHEVSFILSMLTDYPYLPEDLANRLYQRTNLLYISVYHGWATAIAATNSVSSLRDSLHRNDAPSSNQFPANTNRLLELEAGEGDVGMFLLTRTSATNDSR